MHSQIIRNNTRELQCSVKGSQKMIKQISKTTTTKPTIPKERRNITTSNEKVVALRKEYYLSQEDLAGDELNRTLISYIENGRINLTAKSAEKIVRSVNLIFEARNVDKELKVEDLLVVYDDEVRDIIAEYVVIIKMLIEKKKSIPRTLINEIEGFLYSKTVWKEKAELYELIGDTLQKDSKYNRNETFTYYSKALELYEVAKSKAQQSDLIIKIAEERVGSKAYSEAIQYVMCINESAEGKEQIVVQGKLPECMAYQYWAKAYLGLGQYGLAIEKYKLALKHTKHRHENKRAEIILEMGQCYLLNNDYIKGNNCFKNVFRIYESNEKFNEYCLAMNAVLGTVMQVPDDYVENKLFKLDQLSNDMEFALKYVDSDYTELYKSYMMLSKASLYMARNDKSAAYARIAYDIVMENKSICAISEFLNGIYKVAKELKLADEFVNESVIERLNADDDVNGELKNGVLAFAGLLIGEGAYEKACGMVEGVLECMGH